MARAAPRTCGENTRSVLGSMIRSIMPRKASPDSIHRRNDDHAIPRILGAVGRDPLADRLRGFERVGLILVVSVVLSLVAACGRPESVRDGPVHEGEEEEPGIPRLPSKFTNLEVLPSDISKDDLKKTNATLILEGKKTFETKDCAECHGKQATGTGKGPNLTTGTWQHSDGSLEGLTKTITNGVFINKIKNKQFTVPMPSGSKYLSKEQIAALAAYIHSLNKKD